MNFSTPIGYSEEEDWLGPQYSFFYLLTQKRRSN